MKRSNQCIKPILQISYQDTIIHISEDNALVTKEDAGINAALNKTAVLETVTQLGKLVIPCLLKLINTLISLENVEFLVLIVRSIETNR